MWHFQVVAPPARISRGSSACSQADKIMEHRKTPVCIGFILRVMHVISVLNYLAKIAACQGFWEMRNQFPVTTYLKKTANPQHINAMVKVGLGGLEIETVMKHIKKKL